MGPASLFDALHGAPIRRPVDPDGAVVTGEIDEVLTFRPPGWTRAWSPCVIELHQDRDRAGGTGLWMWSVSVTSGIGTGNFYRVGPKWGQFAKTRDGALFHAVAEARQRLAKHHADGPLVAKIATWLDGLQP